MKQRMVTWGLALTLVLVQGMWSEANAAPNRVSKARTPTRSVSRSAPSVRNVSRTSSVATRSRGTASSRTSRSGINTSARSRGVSSSSLGQALGSALAGRANGLGSGYGGNGAYGSGTNGDVLSQLGYYFDRAQRENHHRSDEDREYRSYRDAMIANTVVQVVGMVTSAQQPRQVCAPAPPVHEVRRVVVEEGHYVQSKVYVEPVYSSRTGALIGGGYYETHSRWVPPRYEERMVLVERR